MTETKVILVDVDGTLADNSHRQHFVRHKPRNWKAFNANLHKDTPHEHIVWLVKLMKDAGCKIVIVTARTSDQRERTETWLKEVAGIEYDGYYTREEKDYRDDSIVKLELLEQVRNDWGEPYMVLDDRNRVVDAWRSAGIRCLQVQPGDF